MSSSESGFNATRSIDDLKADGDSVAAAPSVHNDNDMDALPLSPSLASTKKKKKNRGHKATAKRGPTALPKSRGTGFEEYFADPPMTADEAAEEKLEIYAQVIPFEERMQSCIQRFRSRRRLQGEQIKFFDEYLFLGGIDTSGMAYAGLDPRDLKALTPAQRREATATDTIHTGSSADDRFYNGDDTAWSVDFTGVAAGFFSIALEHLTWLKPKPMESAIALIENFLKYVMHHDVCPEYADDLTRALEVCQLAREEWPMLQRLREGLPGNFNMAAIELFSVVHPSDWSFMSFSRPDDFDAEAIFCAVCALHGQVDALTSYKAEALNLVSEYCCTVEVIEVRQVDEMIMKLFSRLKIEGHKRIIEPVGRLLVKASSIEDDWEQAPICPDRIPESWLFLENSLLCNIKPGMRLSVKIGTLNVGVSYIKSMFNVVPTFYTFLPQQMMKHFRQPRENERPAPSIHGGSTECAPLDDI